MAMPLGNMVITDKMQQFPSSGDGNNCEIQHRQWFMDERDRFISWLRGEFAAANAIIDLLCHHMRSMGNPGEYDVVMSCIQQRRCNWNPVLHMQQYFSVAEVQFALQQATWKKQQATYDKIRGPEKDLKKYASTGSRQWSRVETLKENHNLSSESNARDSVSSSNQSVVTSSEKDEGKAEKTEEGKQRDVSGKPDEVDSAPVAEHEGVNGTTNSHKNGGLKVAENPEGTDFDESNSEAVNEEGTSNLKGHCNAFLKSGSDIIQKQDEKQNLAPVPKTFVGTEMFDGKAFNVVDGLKLYEELLDRSEISRLVQMANELRSAGRRGQLKGQAFIISKRPMKGRGREMIQLGLPIADAPQDDDALAGTAEDREMEPIPILLKDVIERMVSLQITTVKPDSCIIDFFDEGDHSQPHICPPWFGRPVCVLFLTECDMTFGRVIRVDHPGDYRGSLKLSLLSGSLLTMQGKSTDFAKHAISSVRKQRILVTFTKSQPKKTVSTDGHRFPSSAPPPLMAWGPLPGRGPNHVWHPAGAKHYGAVTASGVLPVPPIHQQHLPPPSSMQPIFVTSPVAPAMPYPAPVPLPPTSSGWAALPSPKHPPPRIAAPGTGVFLPPPGSGSGSGSPLPQQAFSSTGTPASTLVEQSAALENNSRSDKLNHNSASPRGKLDGNVHGRECNGSKDAALSGKVLVKEEEQIGDLTEVGEQGSCLI